MKIGIDGRLWYETGVGRYIRALIFQLVTLDTRHHYVLFVPTRALKEINSLPNVHVIACDVRWHTLDEQIRMPAIYRRYKIDLLHVPYFSVPVFTNIPLVVTLHDLTISHFATGRATTRSLPIYLIKRFVYEWVIRWAVYKAKQIITVSHAVEKQILDSFPLARKKLHVIYESGELEVATQNRLIDTPKEYILYVGNAHPHKNLEQLIDAFTLVIKTTPNLKLVLIGKRDFFYKRLEEKIIHNKLMANVKIIGEVSNNELSVWYKNARAFIFPSLSEGFGIPGLEAMGFGCPVLASDCRVFREIYQDAAVYFDSSNEQSIAKTIKEVVTNDRMVYQLKEAGKKVFAQYSWKKMARETLRVYERCFAV